MIREAVTGFSKKGYTIMEFKLGTQDRTKTIKCCAEAFRQVCCVSDGSFSRLIREVKDGNVNGMRSFSQFTKVADETCLEAASLILLDSQTRNFSSNGLTQSQKSAMYMSSSALQHQARAWLERYFATSGDYQPNANEEIHLDPIEKKTVHAEYVQDITSRLNEITVDSCTEYLGYSCFIELWDKCFP
jgi:hypothetical protein